MEVFEMPVLSVKELVEEIRKMNREELEILARAVETEFSVSAADPAEETDDSWRFWRYDTRYKVVLTDSGPEPLKVLKLIRRYFELSLSESRKKLKEIPFTIKEPCDLPEARELKELFEETGAVVSVERGDYLIYDPGNCPPGCAYD